jgi:ribosomal protein L37E
MSVIYCSECGKKHEYNFAKPNFCSSCGGSFGAAKSKKADQSDPEDEDEDDDSEEYDVDDDDESFTNATRVPNIRKIQVEIEASTEYNTFTLGSILGSESNPMPKGSATGRKNRSISLEDFKQNKK